MLQEIFILLQHLFYFSLHVQTTITTGNGLQMFHISFADVVANSFAHWRRSYLLGPTRQRHFWEHSLKKRFDSVIYLL